MKKVVEYMSLKKHETIKLSGGNKVHLPEGCTGIIYIFKDQESARNWDGRDVELRKLWFEE